MTLTELTGTKPPRLHGVAEIVPLSLDQYHRMIEVGIVGEDDPTELIDGYIVSKDRGMGFDWPSGKVPPDVPRLCDIIPLWPLSLEQYHRMIEAGVVGEDDPVELIDGYLVAKDQGRGPGMGHGPTHAAGLRQTFDLLKAILGGNWVVQSQLPITLGMASGLGGREPEPDVTVAEGPRQRYATHHPDPSEIRLLVEVADSSLTIDRTVKAPLYAAAGIERYWIVNLVDRQIEVYADPDPATSQYGSREVVAEDQQVTLHWQGLAPVAVQARDLLP